MSRTPAETKHLVQTTFWSDPETALPADEPSGPVTRLFWLVLTLLQHGRADLKGYHQMFTAGEKTLQRDLAKLRKLGERYGFRISRLQRGEVRLLGAKPKLALASIANSDLGIVLQAVAAALGDPVAADLPDLGDTTIADPFLRIAIPRPIQDTAVGHVYRTLRKAAADCARVAFRYRRRDGQERQRTVEPHAVIFHSGRYYLIAYDTRARDWRLFALDAVLGEIRRVGTFIRRPLPAAYADVAAIGLIKTRPRVEVTVELSAAIASAATARSWHHDQRVVRHTDGSAAITFPVYDLGEAVRWAMTFGAEARVVAPPEAVRLAAQTAAQLAQRYRHLGSERELPGKSA